MDISEPSPLIKVKKAKDKNGFEVNVGDRVAITANRQSYSTLQGSVATVSDIGKISVFSDIYLLVKMEQDSDNEKAVNINSEMSRFPLNLSKMSRFPFVHGQEKNELLVNACHVTTTQSWMHHEGSSVVAAPHASNGAAGSLKAPSGAASEGPAAGSEFDDIPPVTKKEWRALCKLRNEIKEALPRGYQRFKEGLKPENVGVCCLCYSRGATKSVVCYGNEYEREMCARCANDLMGEIFLEQGLGPPAASKPHPGDAFLEYSLATFVQP